MELIGDIKSYDWGKLGCASMVAQLAGANDSEFFVKDGTPYAELWMGDHPSGPSKIKTTNVQVTKHLRQNLTFLFKVLSVRKALSIQVHPNKSEAEKLHAERPDIYKDKNHKPELAIALTPFLALCGFRPYTEIHSFCQELPPLKTILGGDESVATLENGTTDNLRNCYKKLMTSTAEETAKCINDIIENYKPVLISHNLLDLFKTINTDFPNDVGVLSLFFLNVLNLKPGQAIFLAANEIHAYLSGDCIECMACSDNVIRAGLTPKYKDVEQLISMLNYTGSPASQKIFQPHRIDAHVKMFVPPVEDFAVLQLNLDENTNEYSLQIQPTTSILLTLQGERTLRIKNSVNSVEIRLKSGSIVCIPENAAPEIDFIQGSQRRTDYIGYMAMYNCFK